jgi:hypothetical protein
MTDPITAGNFYQRAEEFIKKFGREDQTLPTIAPGSIEFNAWRQYFQAHLRWTPVVLQEILDGRRSEMTVPTSLPQILDPDFVEDLRWEPPAPKQLRSKLTHETIEQLRARYGANWGLKVMQVQKRLRREWHSLSDEELRARYRKPEPSPLPERKLDDPSDF